MCYAWTYIRYACGQGMALPVTNAGIVMLLVACMTCAEQQQPAVQMCDASKRRLDDGIPLIEGSTAPRLGEPSASSVAPLTPPPLCDAVSQEHKPSSQGPARRCGGRVQIPECGQKRPPQRPQSPG